MRLVVLGDLARETAGGDDDLGTTADQALQNLGTDGSSTSTSHQGILALEGDDRTGSRLQTVEVDVR